MFSLGSSRPWKVTPPVTTSQRLHYQAQSKSEASQLNNAEIPGSRPLPTSDGVTPETASQGGADTFESLPSAKSAESVVSPGKRQKDDLTALITLNAHGFYSGSGATVR